MTITIYHITKINKLTGRDDISYYSFESGSVSSYFSSRVDATYNVDIPFEASWELYVDRFSGYNYLNLVRPNGSFVDVIKTSNGFSIIDGTTKEVLYSQAV